MSLSSTKFSGRPTAIELRFEVSELVGWPRQLLVLPSLSLRFYHHSHDVGVSERAETTFLAFAFSEPAGSFCDRWARATTCNHAWAKPFASICSEKVGRLYHISRPVLLKCKGAVQQKPRYFPTPVLLKILKKRQQLAKPLGVGRCRKAWKRTHRTQHTATKVAVAGGNVIWQQLPDKLLSFCCWNVRHSTIFPDQTEHTRSHGSEMRVTTKIRQAQKENMLQRFQPFSHRRISRVMT